MNYTKSLSLLLLFLSFIFSISCASVMPVEIQEAYHQQGGVNSETKIISRPITYDGEKILGVPGEGKATATSVIFQNEKNQYVTRYSNTNTLSKSRIEMVPISDEKFIKIDIERYFYTKSNTQRFVNILLLIPTLGVSASFPHEWYSNNISILENVNGDIKSKFPNDKISEKFAKEEEIDIILNITNTGNKACTDTIIATDTLPDYMQLKEIKYYSPTEISKVTYDKHINGNNQNLVFKVYPGEKGLNKYEYVTIKLTVKPDITKFQKEFAKAN